MMDNNGRLIDYLRISVTDKCNLRCRYCMPQSGVELISHNEVLTLEEIYRVVSIMAQLGIKKIRFTGGEPLVRKNLVKLIRDVNEIPGIEEIAITTNGVLFADMAQELKQAGLTGVNISLDTLNSERFKSITGADAYAKVLAAVKRAQSLKLGTKINCVPCRELNEADIESVASLAQRENVDVRYIELMPIGCGRDFHGIPSDEILARLEAVYGKAKPSYEKRGNGPANYYDFEGFKGKIGFISPMSHRFCSECNRIRLTAEGGLKLCLHYDKGLELKPLLRSKVSDEEIKNEIMKAVSEKPKSHNFTNAAGLEDLDKRKMVQIGG